MSHRSRSHPSSGPSGSRRETIAQLPYVASIFLSATLLFAVQPMVTKLLLPRFGGSPAVWNTAIVFFQAVLLAGYAYAHLATARLGLRRQLSVHVFLVFLPLILLPPAVPSGLVPPPDRWPVPWVIAALAVAIGAPFLALSSNSTLVQRWFAASGLPGADNPYRLYAASNAGSLLGLMAYPFVVEPLSGLHAQGLIWTAGYSLFLIITLALIRPMMRDERARAKRHADRARESVDPSTRQRILWLLRPAVASSLLLSVTLAFTTDVASVPLFWVLPLALYLCTFILAFGDPDRLPLRWLRPATQLSALVCLLLLTREGFLARELLSVVALPTLFLGALTCHGDLASERPQVGRLTEFYLWVSLGGLLGGIANSIVAPAVFDSVAEFPLTLAVLLWIVPLKPSVAASAAIGKRSKLLAVGATLVAALIALGLTSDARTIARGRSFFGVSRVIDSERMIRMVHGTTNHGAQMKADSLRHTPPSYYHPNGPMGALVRTAPSDARICLIGLGTGSLAILGGGDQEMTYYEIDPLVVDLARKHFTYLEESEAEIELRIGDGRRLLALEPDDTCDLLVVDAFTSDTIPTHLLTIEAMELYLRKIKPNGVVVLHISNRHMDLSRVFRGLARRTDFEPLVLEYRPSEEDRAEGAAAAVAAALTRSSAIAKGLKRVGGWRGIEEAGPSTFWTDDHSNLPSVLTDPLTWELDIAP